MTLYRNAGDDALFFRDDAPDKHEIAPGDTFTIQGDQHAERIAAMPGVEPATVAELRARTEEMGLKMPAKARKSELAEVVALGEPEIGAPTA